MYESQIPAKGIGIDYQFKNKYANNTGNRIGNL